MNNIYVKHTVKLIFLIVFQIFILNNIEFSGYINPFIYIVFILHLPLNTPKWLLLILGFGLGISIDIFSDTAGMHAIATVFLAFLRPGVINMLSQKQEVDADAMPSIRDMGLSWFFMYSLILIAAHHFVLFYIEVFRFSEFFVTFSRAALSTFATFLLIIISEYLFIKK